MKLICARGVATMWLIYVYYCNFGHTVTQDTVSPRNMLKLIRDCNIRDDRVTATTVDIVMAKYGTRGFDIRSYNHLCVVVL